MSKTEIEDVLEYDFETSFSLTSIINSQQNIPRSITNTLMDFFSQKVQTIQRMNTQEQQKSQQSILDFTTYLNQVSSDLNNVKKRKAKRKINEESMIDIIDMQDMTKCWSDIPYIFFEKEFVLNMQNYGVKDKMKEQQQELNQYLDLIEINLFSQVNKKFNDFYQALINFEDLENRVEDNINRLSVIRTGISHCKKDFLIKAESVSKVNRIKSNKQLLLRHMTVMKSLQKLPPTIKTILQSPLPHESLQLLSTGKSMYKIVQKLQCMKSIGDSLQKSGNIIKHSLYKSFSDKLFLYITTPLNPPFSKQFQVLLISPERNSNDSMIEQPLSLTNSIIKQIIPKNTKTQQQLVATVIESYQSVDFTGGSRIKNKVTQYVKLVTKQFFEELKSHLTKLIKNNILKDSVQIITPLQNLSQILQKVSMDCYSKIMEIYQRMFKQSTTRLLSTAQLLHINLINDLSNIDADKASSILQELLYVMNTILKIICDQISQYITLKKLSRQITIYEFKTYLSPLITWIQYCSSIKNSSIFSSQTMLPKFQMQQYKNRIIQLIFPLQQTKGKLQDAYITNLHMGVINTELKSELEQQTWESVQDINYNYFMTLNYLFNKYAGMKNVLGQDINSSFNESFVVEGTRRQRNRIANHSIVMNQEQKQKQIRDIKLVKNAIILDKRRYKTTKSFLVFCEVLEEYLKIEQIFSDKRVQMIERMGDVSKYFSTYSTQLLVSAGALKFGKIKTKNITIKQMCLLWCNLKLLLEMLISQKYQQFNNIITHVSNRLEGVIKKMSWIICNKVQSQLSNLFKQKLSISAPMQQTINIINSQRQMIEIMQEYLDEQSIKDVMNKSVEIVLKKFFEFLQDKGQRGLQQGKYYVQQMKVLQIYSEKQIQLMKKILKL